MENEFKPITGKEESVIDFRYLKNISELTHNKILIRKPDKLYYFNIEYMKDFLNNYEKNLDPINYVPYSFMEEYFDTILDTHTKTKKFYSIITDDEFLTAIILFAFTGNENCWEPYIKIYEISNYHDIDEDEDDMFGVNLYLTYECKLENNKYWGFDLNHIDNKTYINDHKKKYIKKINKKINKIKNEKNFFESLVNYKGK